MMKNKKKQEEHDNQKPYILQLPNHVIVEIFSKIPIKTVKLRFVCKPWRRLFSNQQFTKELFSQTPTYLLGIDSMKRHFLVGWDNASSAKDDTALKVSQDLTNCRKFVGVCNGLICSYLESDRKLISFYISNPITGESVPLAFPIEETSSERDGGTNLGFGYGPKSQVYKVVVLMGLAQKVMVLTVRLVVEVGEAFAIWYPNYLSPLENGIYVNGYLHWVGLCAKECSTVMYSFNLESETFEELPMPPCCLDSRRVELHLAVFDGCLSVTVRSSYYIRLWVMKKYGVKESWTKEVDIREIPGGAVKPIWESPTSVLEYTKERQVLVLDGRLQSYTKTYRFVKYEVDGIENILDAAYVHIQSFVLLKDLIRSSSLYVQTFRHGKNPGRFTSQPVGCS